MLRALSPGPSTVHGTKRAYNLISRCFASILTTTITCRALGSRGVVRAMHQAKPHAQLQIIAKDDNNSSHNPSENSNVSKTPRTKYRTDLYTPEAKITPVRSSRIPGYLLQNAHERMRSRVHLVSSLPRNESTKKNLGRLKMLMESYVEEHGVERFTRTEIHPALKSLYRTLQASKDANVVWETYQSILLFRPPEYSSTDLSVDFLHSSNTPIPTPSNPFSTRHTIPMWALRYIVRVFASTRPRSRTLFLRFLSVLSAISARGEEIPRWAWNALIDSAGKGWRRTRIAQYKTALSVYNEMLSSGQRHGQVAASDHDRAIQVVNDEDASVPSHAVNDLYSGRKLFEPDIVTLTTLLDIAIETRSDSAIRHAYSLLNKWGFKPTKITHLVRLKDYRHAKGVRAVRNTYQDLEEDGVTSPSIEVLNAFLWTVGVERRVDVLLEFYRVLQKNVKRLVLQEASDVEEDESSYTVVESVPVHASRLPNVITYTTLIQCLSYNGQLLPALDIFRDMLHHAEAKNDRTLQPSMPIFRALFCGFSRYAAPSGKANRTPRFRFSSNHEWNEENLDILFDEFLNLPGDIKASDRMLYWIISSYIRLCGKDSPKIPEIFSRLSQRLEKTYTGRLKRLQEFYGTPASPSDTQDLSGHR